MKNEKMIIKASQIDDELTVCPYCMTPRDLDDGGCCGESSGHFEKAYDYNGEYYRESEVTVIDDIPYSEKPRTLEYRDDNGMRVIKTVYPTKVIKSIEYNGNRLELTTHLNNYNIVSNGELLEKFTTEVEALDRFDLATKILLDSKRQSS